MGSDRPLSMGRLSVTGQACGDKDGLSHAAATAWFKRPDSSVKQREMAP